MLTTRLTIEECSEFSRLREIRDGPDPCAIFFHAPWDAHSMAARLRLEGAIDAINASEMPMLAPPRCFWIDVSTEDGEEAALAFGVRMPGALQCFNGHGKRVLTLSATGAVNAGEIHHQVSIDAIALAACALIALGNTETAATVDLVTKLFADALSMCPSQWMSSSLSSSSSYKEPFAPSPNGLSEISGGGQVISLTRDHFLFF